MNRRILVTGGGGFLGSYLCEKLLERGDEVICVDNLFTGSKSNGADLNGIQNGVGTAHPVITGQTDAQHRGCIHTGIANH